ncbi:MAG: penicillin-binding protein activator [Proteobacteria bacterium]|nr:penicillin-binding protein activator [Pseudomonadota bacterium]
MAKKLTQAGFILFLLILLTACGSGSQVTKPFGSGNVDRALKDYAAENYFRASPELEKAFKLYPGDNQLALALLDSWIQLGEIVRAWAVLDQSNVLQTSEGKILKAELKLFEQQYEDAVMLLERVDSETISASWQSRKYQAGATAHERLGQYVSSAMSLINMSELLDIEDQASFHEKIIKTLIQADEYDLIVAVGDTELSAIQQGWLEAAYVDFGADGISGKQWLESWGNHPAGRFFLDFAQVSHYRTIGVLLPLTGKFSVVGKLVQKGMLAAAFSSPASHSKMLFFDTGSAGEFLTTAWYSAMEAGVDIMVGPLDKGSIEQVDMLPVSTVPVMLLNQSELSNYYQFTLSPEEEAINVAQKIIADGHKRVMVIAMKTEWGNRMTMSFAQEFKARGGLVVNNSFYQPEQNDYSAQLRQSLGLVESKLRAKSLQQFLKLKLYSKEVVRPDVDAIFLAARPDFARLMIPQLRFNHAAKIPVYSSSHVFSGVVNVQLDKDLNGVKFGLSPFEINNPTLNEQLDFDTTKMAANRRLFAFGYDAYSLVFRLDWMQRVNSGQLSGLSGVLNMGFDGVIRRKLVWAEFSNGEPVLIKN